MGNDIGRSGTDKTLIYVGLDRVIRSGNDHATRVGAEIGVASNSESLSVEGVLER